VILQWKWCGVDIFMNLDLIPMNPRISCNPLDKPVCWLGYIHTRRTSTLSLSLSPPLKPALQWEHMRNKMVSQHPNTLLLLPWQYQLDLFHQSIPSVAALLLRQCLDEERYKTINYFSGEQTTINDNSRTYIFTVSSSYKYFCSTFNMAKGRPNGSTSKF
jgi:hypothetical protein